MVPLTTGSSWSIPSCISSIKYVLFVGGGGGGSANTNGYPCGGPGGKGGSFVLNYI